MKKIFGVISVASATAVLAGFSSQFVFEHTDNTGILIDVDETLMIEEGGLIGNINNFVTGYNKYSSVSYPMSYEELASSYANSVFINRDFYVCGSNMDIYDYNDVNAYAGFSYCENSELLGSLVISKNARDDLFQGIYDMMINDTEKYVVVDNVIYKDVGDYKYYSSNGEEVTQLELHSIMKHYSEEKKNKLSNFDLDNIEYENSMNLNRLFTDDLESDEEYSIGNSGGNSDGYSMESSEIASHLDDRYGSGYTISSSDTISGVESFIMRKFGRGNHCVLTAYTRIFAYHDDNGHPKFKDDHNDLFSDIEAVAKNNELYDSGNGVDFNHINNVGDDYLRHVGYRKKKFGISYGSNASTYYTFSFNGQVKNEVEDDSPVILAMTSGSYENHAVTVVGYKTYKKTTGKWFYKRTHYVNFVEVYDGWSSEPHYIDYNAFTTIGSDMFSFASFTEVHM